MRTYGELFRVPEFGPLFVTVAVQILAATISGLVLSTLVFDATGSPLLAALSLFGSSLTQVIGAATLLSTADRLRPRTAIVGIALVFALATAGLATPGLPVWGIFGILLTLGLVNAVAGGVRWGLLGDIVPEDGYILGRSVFNLALGVTQIGGYGLGGVLLVLVPARDALLVSTALYLVAAATARIGLAARAPRSAGRPSVRESWRVDVRLLSDRTRRHVYLAMWVPNGLIVGCEALFVPYAPGSAWVLFMACALGMLVGDVVVGRFLRRRWQVRVVTPLRLLLAIPFLVFLLPVALPAVAAAVAVAASGFSAGLLLQDRLIELTPREVRGQALGLHSAGLLTMQAVGATIGGAIAQFVPAGTAIGALAAASVVVTVVLTPGLRRTAATAP